MSRLAIISLGALGGALLEACARRPVFESIVVATRDVDNARAKANNARIGAGLEGFYPDIEEVFFDMHAEDAPSRLADLGADVVFASPSMMPWWQIGQLSGERRDRMASAPFAAFMACHLAPMLALRDAWARAACSGIWVGASYPDVVNHVLRCTGAAPACGTGNLAEVIPKLRRYLAGELGLDPRVFDVRLVAQHAFEYFCLSDAPAGDPPPYLLYAGYEDRDLSAVAEECLFEPYPIPYRLDLNRITASASLEVLEALVGTQPRRCHVPAPQGRLGGYPVRVSRDGVVMDLPPRWSEAQALDTNRASLPYDGIEEIDPDGTVHFTAACVDALEGILGRRVPSMTITDAPVLADALVAAVGA